MKGDPKVIAALNQALAGETAAILQYLAHYAALENWGFSGLVELVRNRQRDEQKHADRLALRILELEGAPVVDQPGAIFTVTADVPGQFEKDKTAELTALADYAALEQAARAAGDLATLELAISIGREEAEHLAEIESWQDQIGMMGLPAFLAARVESKG